MLPEVPFCIPQLYDFLTPFLRTSYCQRRSNQRYGNRTPSFAASAVRDDDPRRRLIFFGVFFAAVTAERRRRNKVTRAILGQLEPLQEHHEDAPRSRYAYAMEQLEREPLVYQQIQPVYFRGRNLEQRGR